MKGLDLSKFKKLSSDKESTTLKHSDGHELKIAHKALSKKMMSDLEALPAQKMADGGEPEIPEALRPSDASDAPPQMQVQPDLENVTTPNYTTTPQADPNNPLEAGKSARQDFGDFISSLSSDTAKQNNAAASAALEQPQEQQAPQSTLAPQTQETNETQEPIQAQASNQAQANPQAPMASTSNAIPASNALAAKSPEAKAINTRNDLAKEDQSFTNDLNNGHITPQTYHDWFAKKDTLGKVGAIFGLMLGGIGSGLTHQPNAAMEMIKRELDTDFEAQKRNQENKTNLYRLNNEHQVQLAQINSANAETKLKADALTRAQMNRVAFHSLVQQTNKLPVGSPQRTQAEQTLAMLSQAVNTDNFNIMDRASALSAMLGSGSGGQSQAGGDQAVDYNKLTRLQRTGLMPASDAAEATKEANKVEEIRSLRKEYVDSFNKLSKMSGAGAFSPNQRAALANALMAKLAKQSAGRFNLQESAQMVKGMLPSATDVGKETTKTKLQKGLEYFDAEEAGQSTLKRYGLINPPKETASNAGMQDGQTGTYQGKPVIRQNGKWVYK